MSQDSKSAPDATAIARGLSDLIVGDVLDDVTKFVSDIATPSGDPHTEPANDPHLDSLDRPAPAPPSTLDTSDPMKLRSGPPSAPAPSAPAPPPHVAPHAAPPPTGPAPAPSAPAPPPASASVPSVMRPVISRSTGYYVAAGVAFVGAGIAALAAWKGKRRP